MRFWPFSRRPLPPGAGVIQQRIGAPQNRTMVGQLERFYKAAQPDRLTAGWPMLPVPTDWIIRWSLRPLRARSREQVENNDYARRFVNLVTSNVVGPHGAVLQAQIRHANGDPDDKANKAIVEAWRDWGMRENCDITGRMSWPEQQRLFMRTVAQDGEALVRIIRGKSAGKHAIALQHLDPELLDVFYSNTLPNGNWIAQGVEFNPFGRPVAYHLMQPMRPSSEQYVYSYYGKHYIRVPATDIIHEYLPERVDQKRGLPWLATALMRMKMLDGYEEAAVVAARVGAAKLGVWESPTGEEYTGDDTDTQGNTIMDADPGEFVQAPTGVKLNKWDPAYPDSQFSAFCEQILRGISSGLGVCYNTLANDLKSVNYSSIRHGTLEDRELWKMLQDWMIGVFPVRMYREWLDMQMLTGALQVPTQSGTPASFKPQNMDKYRAVRFQGRRWSWVDPQKDASANVLLMQEGMQSRSAIMRDRGDDPETVWREIAQERKLMTDLGLEDILAEIANEKITERI